MHHPQAQPLSADRLQLAMQAYLQHAWPAGAPPRRVPSLDPTSPLSAFEEDAAHRRYWLRLGNAHYPHMKLVIELTEFGPILSVDCHDDAALPADAPQQAEWRLLQARNARIREAIEAAWASLGLPTRALCAQHLPARAGAAEPFPAPASPSRGVLVVDDELDCAHLMAVTLRCAGIPVEIATSGTEALCHAQRTPPGLVLCDYMMPEISGRELLSAFRNHQRLKHAPFVVASYATLDPAEFPGAAALIAKPLYGKRLVALVRRLLPAGASRSRQALAS